MRHAVTFVALCAVSLLTAATCDSKKPFAPPSPTGGVPSVGGATSGGTTAETTASGGAGGDSATVIVATGINWPECSNSVRRAPDVRRNLSGWRRDKKAAKQRKIRPTYSIVPGAQSVFWSPNVNEALDQGSLGSCVGNAVAQCLSTQPFKLFLDQSAAVRIYSEATKRDPFPGVYPPVDSGSNGVAGLSAAQSLGYFVGKVESLYALEDVQIALQRGPCIIGTDFYDGMFSPTYCGELVISGPIVGGHEQELIGFDVDKKVFWLRNSWGNSWGKCRFVDGKEQCGFAYLSAGSMQKLMNSGAEIDCPVP